MFVSSFKHSAPPQNDNRIRRSRLTLEALEDRTTPSTTVFNQTYNWSNETWGPVSIEVTVTEEVIGGDDVYLWEYAVTNDPENNMSVGYFALPAIEPDPNYPIGLDGIRLTVGDRDSTQDGWVGGIDYATDRPFFVTDAYIWWEIGNEPIELGQSGVFSFVTAPTTISSGTGIVKEAPGIAPVIIGQLAVPVAPKPWIVETKSDVIADDGLASIREAVTWVLGNQGPPNRPVQFDVDGPITLDPAKDEILLGHPTQARSITILGPQTIQRSGEVKQIFRVPAPATVNLDGLTLREGKSNLGGGAVSSSGNLTVTSCIFSENEAAGSLGGAIAATGGALTINGTSTKLTRFTGNSARWGGALYIGTGVTTDINWSEFVLNSATTEGGAIFIESSSGQNPTTVSLVNTDVNGNLCSGSRGGGIMVSNSGGAGTSLTLASTQVRNNVVSGANSKGGGVFFGAGVIDLLGVTFQDNEATSGDGMYMVTGTDFADTPIVTLINDNIVSGPF